MHYPFFELKLTNLKNKLFRPEVIQEMTIHYDKNVLPDSLELSWFRDGSFIVGKIRVPKDGVEFMTQAESADEFVEMVNDAMYATYNIPQSYIPYVKKIKPPLDQYKQLDDLAIKKSKLKLTLQNV